MSVFILPQLDKVFPNAHTLCRLLAMLEGDHQSFEEVAKAFSTKREDTTPDPPFTDETSIFEEEAPSSAQRRLAYDFYSGITSLVDGPGRTFYPSPLDIVELHRLHLEAIRASVGEGEIVPEYSLQQVTGASKRLVANAEAGSFGSEIAQPVSGIINRSLQSLLEQASRLEAIGYPLVTQHEAIVIQQNLWDEARGFLEKTFDYYRPDMIGSKKILSGAQYFPEEHPIEARRLLASGAVFRVQDDLRWFREGELKRYGVKEALASATNFGHDDVGEYNLVNVLGAAKRQVIRSDVQGAWEGSRDTFTSYKLLAQGVENRQR